MGGTPLMRESVELRDCWSAPLVATLRPFGPELPLYAVNGDLFGVTLPLPRAIGFTFALFIGFMTRPSLID